MTHTKTFQLLNRNKILSQTRLSRSSLLWVLLVFISAPAPAKESESENLPAATRWYRELAAEGDIEAKYNLGMMNETGWSIPVNNERAVRWYREAAKQGHAEAQFRLGMLYYIGLGAKQSKLKGESWIRKAANQDHNFARFMNQNLFEKDVPDTLNYKSVIGKVRKIYLQDQKKANSALNNLIDEAKQKSSAQELAKKETTIRERREGAASANSSYPEKIELERIESVVPEFIGKKSLKENRTLARGNIATIRLQANKGLASAQYNLGRMYELGIKVPVDKSIALDWYKKSADQGYADAQYRLAISKLYGMGTKRDEEIGRKWLSLAAGNGHQIARNLLTKLTDQEGVFSADNSIAVTWYLELAMTGDAGAALALGNIYEHGWGVNADLREALKWYQHARMLGSEGAKELISDAKKQLALLREKAGQGDGVAGDIKPPNWIAYVIGGSLALGIIFWPLLKGKTFWRRKS